MVPNIFEAATTFEVLQTFTGPLKMYVFELKVYWIFQGSHYESKDYLGRRTNILRLLTSTDKKRYLPRSSVVL